MSNNKIFYALLANSLAAGILNTVVWFAVTFWVYLETRSVLTTSVMAGVYVLTVALSGVFLGSLVDRFRKKTSMLVSSTITLCFYAAAFAVYTFDGPAHFARVDNPLLWVFITLILLGSIAGNIRMIAISTIVTILFPEDRRANANGLVGMANGVNFLIGSVMSGFVIGLFGMSALLSAVTIGTVLVIVSLLPIKLPEREVVHANEHNTEKIDIKGTIAIITLVPGLFGLIFFHAFNNFLGGVFMALMDAYGLELMRVEMWGLLFGFLSLGFIAGGMIVAKWGLGKNPLRTLFLANIVLWVTCIFFTIQPWIWLLALGMLIWMTLGPVVEAAEQTIFQKTIPLERQGRVFGFAQSVEQAASPITAFVVGPLAQFVFIPFMTTGAGVTLIGDWFGVGVGRGIALLFIMAGVTGLAVTLLAMRSRSYKALSGLYPN